MQELNTLRLVPTEFYTSIQADNTTTFTLINKTITGCDFSTDATTTVTITFPSPHGMSEDDIVFLDTVTAPPGSGYTDADFEDKKFMATSIPTATTITITMGSAASGTTTNVGSARAQTLLYGWTRSRTWRVWLGNGSMVRNGFRSSHNYFR